MPYKVFYGVQVHLTSVIVLIGSSIFQDKSVTSSIPDYFQNSEPPIICYKYNKPIRHTIFNFNKLVSDLDIHANTPSS